MKAATFAELSDPTAALLQRCQENAERCVQGARACRVACWVLTAGASLLACMALLRGPFGVAAWWLMTALAFLALSGIAGHAVGLWLDLSMRIRVQRSQYLEQRLDDRRRWGRI